MSKTVYKSTDIFKLGSKVGKDEVLPAQCYLFAIIFGSRYRWGVGFDPRPGGCC